MTELIWVLVWITCASSGCYEERIEQEFLTHQDCQYALDFYRVHHGVVGGVCMRYTEAEG